MMVTRGGASNGEAARFMSQRQSPALALLSVSIVEEERDERGRPIRTVFQLSSDALVPGTKVKVSYPPAPSQGVATTTTTTDATVWSDSVRVVDLGDEAAAFVTLLVDTFEDGGGGVPPVPPTGASSGSARAKAPRPPTSIWGPLRLTCIDPATHARNPGNEYMPSVALSDHGSPRPTSLSDGFPFLLRLGRWRGGPLVGHGRLVAAFARGLWRPFFGRRRDVEPPFFRPSLLVYLDVECDLDLDHPSGLRGVCGGCGGWKRTSGLGRGAGD
jgi:hypothetical protein